jgi:phage/plasmid-like protein (TIGR03299 family)
MCKLNRPPVEIVKGDDVVKYLLFSNSHDGSTCVRVGFTMVEVVCANTLHAAHSDTASELVRIRHSKDVETNVSNLVDTVNTVDAQMEANAAQMRLLTKKDINQKDLEKYIKEVFKMEEKENEDGTLCLATRTKNNLKEIMGLYHKNLQAHLTEKFESGPNSTGPARGTLWNAYGAISEYLTHKRGRGGENMDTKLDSLWFGSSSQLNKRAFELALAMAM